MSDAKSRSSSESTVISETNYGEKLTCPEKDGVYISGFKMERYVIGSKASLRFARHNNELSPRETVSFRNRATLC